MTAVLDRSGLDALVEVLIDLGYRVVGPTVRDDAIVLAELASGARTAGRLGRRHRAGPATGCGGAPTPRCFGHSAGPQSWKQFLHPPRQRAVVLRRRRRRPSPAPEEPRALRIPRRPRL